MLRHQLAVTRNQLDGHAKFPQITNCFDDALFRSIENCHKSDKGEMAFIFPGVNGLELCTGGGDRERMPCLLQFS